MFNERVIAVAVPDRYPRAACGHGDAAKPLPPQAFGAIMNIP
jgi:hypothetical protein